MIDVSQWDPYAGWQQYAPREPLSQSALIGLCVLCGVVGLVLGGLLGYFILKSQIMPACWDVVFGT